jgi:hypothetical protein
MNVQTLFYPKGLFRTYFIKDGKEISRIFSSIRRGVIQPRSFRTRTLDIYNIDALENTDALCLEM